MSPAQFEVMRFLFGSGFKPEIWGSDGAGWRIGPVFRVSTRTKVSLERAGWVRVARSRVAEGAALDWLAATDEGRRAFIAAGGDPGPHGRSRKRRRAR